MLKELELSQKHKVFQRRKQWLDNRKDTIGASDVATILGINPYQSAYDLWAEKTGFPSKRSDSLVLRLGHYMESFITREYKRETGVQCYDPGEYAVFEHPDHPFLTCTPDRLVVDKTTVPWTILRAVELKNIGEMASWSMEDRGTPPLKYQVQLQTQMSVLGIKHGTLAYILGGRSFHHVDIEYDEELMEMVLERVCEFRRLVLSGEPPEVDGSASTSEAIARMHPNDNGETIDLPLDAESALETLIKTKQTIKELEEKASSCENIVKEMLGDNTFGSSTAFSVSWKTQERKASISVPLELESFLKEHGLEYNKRASSSSRYFRYKANKEKPHYE